jgi:chromosome segregation ATPase
MTSMGRPGITYYDVANAAQQVAGRGNNPTIEAIRIVLKSGSSSTIAQHLRTWKAKQTSTQQIAVKENLPEEFVAVMKGLWEKLVAQADEQIQHIQQASEQAITLLKQELGTLKQENQQSQQQYQLLEQQKTVLQQEKQTLDHQWVQGQTENIKLQTQCEGLLQQLQEKQARLDELHQLHQQVQANLEHYRQAALEQRRLDQQRTEQQHRQLEHTLAHLQQELKGQQQQNNGLQQQAEQSRLQQENLQTALTQLNTEYETLKISEAKHAKDSIELQKQQASLVQKISFTEATLKELRTQNKQLTTEKWEIGQEKAVLAGQLKQLEASL